MTRFDGENLSAPHTQRELGRDDLVKRLRHSDAAAPWRSVAGLAADRIEALESEVRSLRDSRNYHQAKASIAKGRLSRLRKRKAALMSALLEIKDCDDLREAKFIARIGHDGWEDDEIIYRNRERIRAGRPGDDMRDRLTAMTENAEALAEYVTHAAPYDSRLQGRREELSAAHAKLMEGK